MFGNIRLRTSILLAVSMLMFASLSIHEAFADDEPPVAPVQDDELEPVLELEDEAGQPLTIDVEAQRLPAPVVIEPQPVLPSPAPLLPVPTPPQPSPASEAPVEDVSDASFRVDSDEVLLTRTPQSVQEALLGLPGVHVRGEATGGLIPNIGFRGLNPDRSEGLLILEDGVPASFAPYSVNASYFLPPLERLEGMDVIHGPRQIIYGPHTVGGVLNLRTHEIPDRQGGVFKLAGGTDGYGMGHIHYGGREGRTGALISATYKQSDGYRDHTQFDVVDVMAKLSHDFGPRTRVLGKIGYYRQESNSTYLGLTEGMFQHDPHQNPIRHDTFDIEWFTSMVRWEQRLSTCLRWETSAYFGSGYRDWNRQDFARNNGFAAAPGNTVQTVGDPTIDGGAIYLRESYGSRDRDFRRWGVESRILGTWNVAGMKHEFVAGVRYHDELFINARHNRVSRKAAPVTRDRDTTDLWALSAYVQDSMHVTRRFRVLAGARVEHYSAKRVFSRQSGADVHIRGDAELTEVMPAVGVSLDLDQAHTLHAGLHRGFAPPRTSQAIDSTGTDLDLEAEKSWNYEAGISGRPRRWLNYSLTAFLIDFENQVVPANESGGASTTNTNAGETQNYGVEFAAKLDLLAAARSKGRRCAASTCAPKLWLDTAWTWVETENTTSGGLFDGNELPYAPNWIGHVELRAELPRYGITASLWASYVGEQFTDQANTVAASADGTVGEIPEHWVLDAKLRYRVPRTRTSLFANVGNLLDEEYITSRAPRGIFPGARRHVVVGLEMDL